jgi:hypothetical protein
MTGTSLEPSDPVPAWHRQGDIHLRWHPVCVGYCASARSRQPLVPGRRCQVCPAMAQRVDPATAAAADGWWQAWPARSPSARSAGACAVYNAVYAGNGSIPCDDAFRHGLYCLSCRGCETPTGRISATCRSPLRGARNPPAPLPCVFPGGRDPSLSLNDNAGCGHYLPWRGCCWACPSRARWATVRAHSGPLAWAFRAMGSAGLRRSGQRLVVEGS